jgi:hypothetical protein
MDQQPGSSQVDLTDAVAGRLDDSSDEWQPTPHRDELLGIAGVVTAAHHPQTAPVTL